MAAFDEFMRDARHDSAGRRDVGFEVGAEDDEVHGVGASGVAARR